MKALKRLYLKAVLRMNGWCPTHGTPPRTIVHYTGRETRYCFECWKDDLDEKYRLTHALHTRLTKIASEVRGEDAN